MVEIVTVAMLLCTDGVNVANGKEEEKVAGSDNAGNIDSDVNIVGMLETDIVKCMLALINWEEDEVTVVNAEVDEETETEE